MTDRHPDPAEPEIPGEPPAAEPAAAGQEDVTVIPVSGGQEA
ncbi:3-dehydroquinate synthase, partial [Micrococcus endophyticus]